MKTRIEEMVESCYGVGDDGTPQAYDHLIEQALTQAHQAGIDEAVEIVEKLRQKPTDPVDRFANRNADYNDAIDDFTKALQDNK